MKTSHRVQSKNQPWWEAWQITAGGKKISFKIIQSVLPEANHNLDTWWREYCVSLHRR